jgi:hypothetical protein
MLNMLQLAADLGIHTEEACLRLTDAAAAVAASGAALLDFTISAHAGSR